MEYLGGVCHQGYVKISSSTSGHPKTLYDYIELFYCTGSYAGLSMADVFVLCAISCRR